MTRLRFKSNLQVPALQRALIPGIDKYIQETIEQAARIWVTTAAENIPVWSGASRATLQALASQVGVTIPIKVSDTAPDRIALGRLVSRGGVEREGRGRWLFYYESQLNYLAINETQVVLPKTHGLRGSLISPTPYKFQEAATRAAEIYINQRIENLPLSRVLRFFRR